MSKSMLVEYQLVTDEISDTMPISQIKREAIPNEELLKYIARSTD